MTLHVSSALRGVRTHIVCSLSLLKLPRCQSPPPSWTLTANCRGAWLCCIIKNNKRCVFWLHSTDEEVVHKIRFPPHHSLSWDALTCMVMHWHCCYLMIAFRIVYWCSALNDLMYFSLQAQAKVLLIWLNCQGKQINSTLACAWNNFLVRMVQAMSIKRKLESSLSVIFKRSSNKTHIPDCRRNDKYVFYWSMNLY